MREASLLASFQRGAISIMAAVGLSVAIGAALLAVDLGSLFHERRHLQTVVDNAALSAVNDPAQASAIALDAASQNGFVVDSTSGSALEVVPGRYDARARQFFPGGAPALHNAVQVTARAQQPYFFALGSRQVTATATALRDDQAALSIGTAVADIDTEKSILLNALLGRLLNTSLNLSAVAFQGLVDSSVRLLDLVNAHARIGTVEELLALDMTVGQLLELTARALERNSLLGVDADVIGTLDLLALRADGNLQLKLGDLIKTEFASGNQAAEARINLMQLIALSAQVANGEHFLNLPALGIDLPGLLKLDVALTLVEAPAIAIGPAGQDPQGNWLTSAHSAQARVKLDLLVGELLGGVVHLPLYVEAGAGDAWLEAIDCRYPRADSQVMIGARSGTARAYVGEVNPGAMSNRSTPATVSPATILNVLGLVTVTARAMVEVPAGNARLSFNGPFDSDNTQRIEGLATAGLFDRLADDLVLDVNLLGLSLGLGDVLSPLLALLSPVFGVLDSLLAPVLSLLGIQLGVADVTAFDLRCGAPQLVR